MSSSISQAFTVTVIPKQAFPAPILISPRSLVPNANTLDVAISKYSVLKYLINPTPKLVHSTPITSDETITAFCAPSFGSKRADKKCYLHLDSEHEVLVPGPVINCYTLNDNTTVAVLQDGTIQKYARTKDSSEWKEVKTSKISYKGISKAFFIDGNYLLVINQDSMSLFDLQTMTELATRRIDFVAVNSEFKVFKGKLYRYDVRHSLFEIYNIVTLEDVHSLKIPFVKRGDIVTFSPIEDMKVILTRNNVAFLLDLSLGSVIATTTFEHLKWFRVLEGVESTLAIGLSCTVSSGELKLEILNLELDTTGSTLKSALGRGLANYVPDNLSNRIQNLRLSLKPLLVTNDNNAAEGESEGNNVATNVGVNEGNPPEVEIRKNLLPETFDYNKILKKLKNKVNNVESFDLCFFDSLNIKNDYYTENDRAIINQDFLRDVIDLILQSFTFNENEPYPRAMTYLLTHPFFPRDKAKNLLVTLRGNPHLYKQAVVTCPNIPLEELLTELFSIENNELSLDISLRVLEDFTRDEIREKLKLLPTVDVERFIEFIIQTDKDYNQDLTADNTTDEHGNSNIVAKISDDPRASTYVFELLSLVIDSVGLLALEGELLKDLTDFINKKVDVAAKNSELYHMLEYRTSIKSDNLVNPSSKLKKHKGKRVIPPYTVEYLNV